MNDILVVKLGGGAGLNWQSSCADLAQLAKERPLIVVHGVSEEANRLCAERGIEVKTLVSPSGHESRYTDAQTRDVYVEAARNVNRNVISELAKHGVVAQLAEQTILATMKQAVRAVVNGRVRVVHDNYTGSIDGVLGEPLVEWLQQGIVPVIPPEGYSTTDGILNIDGDRAAGAVASHVKAKTLIILSNVRGLYRHYPDEDSFVPHVPANQLESAMEWAQGRMKRKVLGVQEALKGGVSEVIIADGRTEHPILEALNGSGTVFTA